MTSDSLENIENLVTSAFDEALNKGNIIFKSEKIVQERIDGCSYQIRYLPSLHEKHQDSSEKNIHVCDLSNDGSNYSVVLSQYPIAQHHFLLVPQESSKQPDFLSADDLSLIYRIIRNHTKRNLIAFYNCGEDSGSNQTHKTIQFVPVSNNEPPIDVYLQRQQGYDQGCQLAQVPWAHFVISIDPSDDLGDYLMGRFIRLLDLMFDFRRKNQFDSDKSSYNVLITKTHLHMIPRSKDKFEFLTIDGLSYSGILIATQDEDLNEIQKIGITNILLAVGREKNEQSEE